MIFEKMKIDALEVLEAASTKWNFLPFRPGLVGGHCIGVDPYYLTFRAESLGYHPEMILSGRRINDGMGKYIAERAVKMLIRAGRKVSEDAHGGERDNMWRGIQADAASQDGRRSHGCGNNQESGDIEDIGKRA